MNKFVHKTGEAEGPMRAASYQRRQSGFSVVELMVALLLGTLLIGGAISIYLASTRSSQETERSTELLDSGRFALQVLGDSLRHAGFFAGVESIDVTTGGITGDCAGNTGAYRGAPINYILGAVVNASGNALGCINDGVPGTDVLLVRGLLPAPLWDVDPNAPGATVPATNRIEAGMAYVATNLASGRTMSSSEAENLSNSSDPEYTQIWPYSFQVFYIQQQANQPPTLARKVLNGTSIVTQALVEGVEDMRVRYYYGNNQTAYVPTPPSTTPVPDWNDVHAVEVFLLLRSGTADQNYINAKTYALGDRAPLNAPYTSSPERNFARLLVSRQLTLRNPSLVQRYR